MTYFNLKSIDITSTTVIGACISTILSIIIAIIFLIITASNGGAEYIGQLLTIVCSFVFGTLIFSVYHVFAKTYLYNLLSTSLDKIQISLFENKEIKKVSVKSTSIILTLIDTILFIIYYLVGIFLLEILLSVLYSIVLMVTGNIAFAYILYNFIMLMSDPLFIIGFIVGYAIISLIKNLISLYSYNTITSKVYGVLLKLRKEDNWTIIDSVNPVNSGLVLGIVGLILGIIEGIISLITAFNIVNFIGIVVGSFVGTFIIVVIVCYLYNFLAPKLGNIKVELTEE